MTVIAARPTAGSVEQRTALDVPAPVVDGRRLHGLIPYNVQSRPLEGGFREIIEPGALADADLTDMIATREHDRSKLLGRHPTTLSTEDRADGFAWSCELPQSPVGEDVRVAIERGDLRATSWRMVVGRDRWDGDVRHVEQIAQLKDVCITAAPCYGDAARAEYRSTPEPPIPIEERPMHADDEEDRGAVAVDDRSAPATPTLRVEDRVGADRPARGLAEAFRADGFPGQTAVMPWEQYESRAVTWTGSVNTLSPTRREGADLGADRRYLWPALPSVAVDAGTTSVDVVQQTARTLAAPADMNRAIDATSVKPETASTIAIATVALRQLASKQAGIPNVYLEQAVVNRIIESDLRHALNEALDALAVAAVAGSPFTDPGTNNILVSIRAAISAIQAEGYQPDTLVLRPQDAEAIDTMRATATPGEDYFIFAPGQFAPGSLFGLTRRVSKSAAAPIVMDSQAFARLYVAPVGLARFEENSGATNTSLIRLETHGVVGVERATAARRIAAS